MIYGKRTVKLSKNNETVMGFKWIFDGQEFILKTYVSLFRGILCPGIFHRPTQAVKRMMGRTGINLLASTLAIL